MIYSHIGTSLGKAMIMPATMMVLVEVAIFGAGCSEVSVTSRAAPKAGMGYLDILVETSPNVKPPDPMVSLTNNDHIWIRYMDRALNQENHLSLGKVGCLVRIEVPVREFAFTLGYYAAEGFDLTIPIIQGKVVPVRIRSTLTDRFRTQWYGAPPSIVINGSRVPSSRWGEPVKRRIMEHEIHIGIPSEPKPTGQMNCQDFESARVIRLETYAYE